MGAPPSSISHKGGDGVGNRIRVSGTVRSVSPDMAMVKPDSGASISANAMMIDAGSQFNGMPLDSFLFEGMTLSGEWDTSALRFFPDFGDWTETRFLDTYPEGTVVLGLVAAVSRQDADVRLHPMLSVTMQRDDVSTNPKDVINHLWSIGDIVSVRVVRSSAGRLRLRHTDVDDDEPIAEAPPVLVGGEPWLTKSRMDLIESTKERWERERSEAEALTKALDVLSKQMQMDIDQLESILESRGTDTGEIPIVEPAAPAPAGDGLTARERSLQEFSAKQIQRMITNYKVEMDKLAERNQRLTEALAAGNRREVDLEDANRALRGQLAETRKEVQTFKKSDHTGVTIFSIADRRSRFGSTEEWIHEEIRRYWIDNYTPSDRKHFSIETSQWRILPSFCSTFELLTDDGMEKAVRAATHIVTGRRSADNMFESHPLREGDESSKPAVVRDDGAVANRAYIESHTSQARRLHFWKLKDGSIELSRVGLHDDFTP